MSINKTTGWMYKLARLGRDAKSVSTGNPKKMAKRVANKAIGRWIVSKLWIR